MKFVIFIAYLGFSLLFLLIAKDHPTSEGMAEVSKSNTETNEEIVPKKPKNSIFINFMSLEYSLYHFLYFTNC